MRQFITEMDLPPAAGCSWGIAEQQGHVSKWKDYAKPCTFRSAACMAASMAACMHTDMQTCLMHGLLTCKKVCMSLIFTRGDSIFFHWSTQHGRHLQYTVPMLMKESISYIMLCYFHISGEMNLKQDKGCH